MTTTYQDFRNAVITALRSYQHVHDTARLDEVAAILTELVASTESLRSAVTELTFSGWLHPFHGFRLTGRALQAANPGWRVSVRRYPRRELGRLARAGRAGYVVTATSELPDAPFAFGAIDRSGRMHAIPASNPDAAYGYSSFFPLSTEDPKSDATLLGYLDEVREAPRADRDRPETWFAALIHEEPSILLQFVDSPQGRSFAQLASSLVAGSRSNARWEDRFALVASGRVTPSSDLLSLEISTPNPSSTPPDAMPVPEPTIDGDVVSYSPGSRLMPVPSDEWLHYNDAVIQDGGIVRSGDTLVVYEASAHPSRDFVSGQQHTLFGSAAHPEAALLFARPSSPTVIPEGILLGGRNDANWFHWLIEYLPRLIQAAGQIDESVPVLISERVPASGVEALRSLTFRPIIVLEAARAHTINSLHLLAPAVQILDTTKVPWGDGLSMNAPALRDLRRAFGLSEGTNPRRRVFLRRKSQHRGLLNEIEISRVAERLGLEIVEPGSMTFAQQLDLFSNAELVAGAGGAVMANYLMMAKDSRVIALTSRGLFDFALPAAIPAAAGAHFSYVTGESTTRLEDADDRNQWLIHSSYTVSAATFERHLARELDRLA